MVLVQKEVKKIYIGSTQVRPSWWKPWANTVAYYPLTSITTTTDSQWTYNLTNGGNVVFGTYQWVDCASFNGTSSSMLSNTSLSFPSSPTQTVSVWMYISWTGNVYQTIYHIWTTSRTWKLWSWFYYNTWLSISSWYGWYESIKAWNVNWAWHLLTNVTNWTSSVQYLDGVEYQSFTNSLTNTQTQLRVGWAQSSSSERLTWYLSNLIVENKARTAQEVTDYYNQTKWDYWL